MIKKRESVVILLYSFIFAVLNIHIILLQHVQWGIGFIVEPILITAATAGVFFIVKSIFKLFPKITKKNINNEKDVVKYYFIVFLVQLLFWGIVFAAYWPGLFSEDVERQLIQGHVSTHHPQVHSFYLQFFYNYVGGNLLKSYNLAIAISVIIQMIIASLALAYSHTFLFEMGLNKIFRYIFIASTSLLPACSLIFICTTKDAFFSAFMCLSFTLIVEYYLDRNRFKRKPIKYALLFFSLMGMVLFRKNGTYPIIAWLGVGVIRDIIKHKIKANHVMIITSFAGMISGMVLLAVIKSVTGAIPGSLNEMLSVPYQQIAYVYSIHEEELSEEEKEMIHEVLPKVEEYEPYRADPVKDYAVIENKKSILLKVWIELGKRYFGDYVTAFLKLNAGYLCVADLSYSTVYGTGNGKGVFMTYYVDGFGVESKSLIPQLKWLYEKLFTDNYFRFVPVLNLLCSPAFYFWTIILLFSFSIVKGKYSLIPEFIFLITYIATLLLGPCSVVRYALPYIVCIPTYFLLVGFEKEINANN